MYVTKSVIGNCLGHMRENRHHTLHHLEGIGGSSYEELKVISTDTYLDADCKP